MHSNQEPIQSYEIDPSKDLDPNIKHYKFEYLLNNTVIVDTFLNVESCSDGIKNRNELFIDCGGDCNVECFDFLSLENFNFTEYEAYSSNNDSINFSFISDENKIIRLKNISLTTGINPINMNSYMKDNFRIPINQNVETASNFIYISEINTEDSKISGYFKCHFILEDSLDDGKNVTPIVIKEDSIDGTFINLKYH